MTMSLITLLVGVCLSAVALIATPLAARVTHRMKDPDAGYFSTTIMALLITAAFGGGAISAIIWIADLGKTASWILIPVYFIGMLVAGRILWRVLGPDARRGSTVGGAHPLGA
ncbi:hypothetical protein T8K17_12865 [Thalassobaculum sp. OXR-137]|uniref:hypothetical protein n=1 Tax=Thalassobaculum sp. OXR-137 TaxID=3100173 RepID=UPI002AC8FF92|nr:hypothetical protein [Thalassobaculum sp. OXR-137]WPZ37018.1 hypothetical protein T8K17_12865 [Thalassobaculum sp. OXR-137]